MIYVNIYCKTVGRNRSKWFLKSIDVQKDKNEEKCKDLWLYVWLGKLL